MCKQESSSEKYANIYTRKELVMMETKKLISVPVSIYQELKGWPLNYHMCAYLVKIIVLSCDAQPSNVKNCFKMFYAVVIILRGCLQAFTIKYNHNTMVEIYQFLYRVLYWSILVHHQRQI